MSERGVEELNTLIAARIEHLNATRGWPWMQPGQVSVGLDDEGLIRRYVATESALIVLTD